MGACGSKNKESPTMADKPKAAESDKTDAKSSAESNGSTASSESKEDWASKTVLGKPYSDITKDWKLGKTIGIPGQYGKAQVCTPKTGDSIERCAKVISLQRFQTGERRKIAFENFRAEYEVMRTLEHPNIISQYGAYEDKENLYFVMELCNGGELFDRISKRKRYTEKDAQVVLRQIMEGLAHMHSKKLVHADLKPDNFLFVDPSEESQLKIIDFGFAKHTDSNNLLSNIAGTCFYMAPEVLNRKYTFHADIWSMGVVMFIMLFGFPPFKSSEQGSKMFTEIKRKIRQGFDPTVKPGFGAWFPEERPASKGAKDLIAKMLVTDPASRLTAEEVLEHPWMTGKDASTEPLQHIVKELRDFYGHFLLKKKLLACLTAALTDMEIAELQKTFEKMDLDKNGFISVTEFKAAVEQEEKSPSMEKIKALLAASDLDNDGQLSYYELIMGATHKKLLAKEDRLRVVFNQLDKNGDKKLSLDEIKGTLQTSMPEAAAMVKEIDADGDGFIDYEEFLRMWKEGAKVAGRTQSQLAAEMDKYNGEEEPL